MVSDLLIVGYFLEEENNGDNLKLVNFYEEPRTANTPVKKITIFLERLSSKIKPASSVHCAFSDSL